MARRLDWNRARPQPKDAEDALRSGVGPILPILKEHRQITTHHEGRCTDCKRVLPTGTRALWNPRTGVLYCSRCGFNVIHAPKKSARAPVRIYRQEQRR